MESPCSYTIGNRGTATASQWDLTSMIRSIFVVLNCSRTSTNVLLLNIKWRTGFAFACLIFLLNMNRIIFLSQEAEGLDYYGIVSKVV